MQMIPTRIFYRKTGRAKYISHLDVMRTMSRALRRSQLPLWYTQGFNPHLYLTFALPLSLGYESLRESVDVRLTEETPMEDVVQRLAPYLPEGFEPFLAATPVQDAAAIRWADYDVVLDYDNGQMQPLLQALEALLAQEQLLVMKKGKKGAGKKVLREVDIRPHVQLLSAQAGESVLQLNLRLAAGSAANINPSLFLEAFYEKTAQKPGLERVCRTVVYTGEGTDLKIFE